MKIVAIRPPIAILDNGKDVELKKIKGQPRIGAMLDDEYKVIGNNVDQDCPGGVCPVK